MDNEADIPRLVNGTIKCNVKMRVDKVIFNRVCVNQVWSIETLMHMHVFPCFLGANAITDQFSPKFGTEVIHSL